MRTMIFVDYWNLQVTLQAEEAKTLGLVGQSAKDHRFNIDWFQIGPKLVSLASTKASPDGNPLPLIFEQVRIYTSSDPNDDGRYKRWATQTLGRKAGVYVSCQDRKPKRNPNCQECHQKMNICPHCKHPINATQEKGVDTLLVTDLLRLGLDKSYDVALLVSQDADMIPAVEHLISKGIRVIHVGIKHFGKGVGDKCWAQFDLFECRDNIKR